MSEDVSFVDPEVAAARIARLDKMTKLLKLYRIESMIEFHRSELEILYARKKELGGCVCIGLSHADDCPERVMPT